MSQLYSNTSKMLFIFRNDRIKHQMFYNSLVSQNSQLHIDILNEPLIDVNNNVNDNNNRVVNNVDSEILPKHKTCCNVQLDTVIMLTPWTLTTDISVWHVYLLQCWLLIFVVKSINVLLNQFNYFLLCLVHHHVWCCGLYFTT